jgi:cell division septation protein DedD
VRRGIHAHAIGRGTAGLGLGQLFALLFGFLLASALIFLFGIWVGRDITERRLASQERVVRMPVPIPPTPAADAKSTEVDLAFYQKLKEKAEQRLQETATAGSPSPAPRLGHVVPAASPASATEKRPPHPTPAVRSRQEPQGRDEWADKGWTVQVNATTSSQQATDLVRALRGKGFDAYTVQTPMHGQTWYRVRVGRFPNRDKAKELEAKLKTNEGMENAYVTSQ